MYNEERNREIAKRLQEAKNRLDAPYVALVGTGMGNGDMLTGEAKMAIEYADVIIGSSRVIETFRESGKLCYAEYRPDEIVKMIKEHPEYKSWVVVLSGDTGFYSGAKKLFGLLREEGIQAGCVPGIASIVYLAAKLGVSWEDAALRSIHGRRQNIVYAIDHNEKTFVLMDKKSAEGFCEAMRTYAFDDVACYIGSRLSYGDERILVRKGCEVTPEDIGELATVLVTNPHPKRRASVHLRDEEFIRDFGDVRVPMTKEEVRAVSMAKLGLTTDSVFYDIGAGSGSISVEAALHSENIRVYAIEQRKEACELIGRNKRKFRTDQVKVIYGKAPEAMEGLEMPTHAFIGGSSGNLMEIICKLKEKNPDVTLVINAISMETIGEVMMAVKKGLLVNPEMVQLNVSKARALGDYHMMMGQNPIYIITERK